MNSSEAGDDLVLVQISLLLLCKSNCSNKVQFQSHKISAHIYVLIAELPRPEGPLGTEPHRHHG